MTDVIDLVDSLEYTRSNCFAHQLHKSLNAIGVRTVQLADLRYEKRPAAVISRLKQRTLQRMVGEISTWAGDTPFVVFDQDPWEAYRDGSAHKGSYDTIRSGLNVRTFAVTTKWWADFLNARDIPATFVKMWLLPEYCSRGPAFVDRSIDVGFVGTVHPYRKTLFDHLNSRGINVNISGNKGYSQFLTSLSNIGCFVHSEDAPFTIDGTPSNLNVGLWIKDIEAASQGCFSVRNYAEGFETYIDENIRTVKLYHTIDDAVGIIDGIKKMDPQERQDSIDRTVEYIKSIDGWSVTARELLQHAQEMK